MLRSVEQLLQCTVEGTDGAIGRVHDLYFDDQAWTVRFLVVATGDWLEGRQVLISPVAIGDLDWAHSAQRAIPARVTREQVRHSPDVDCHKPVSRQHEVENFAYYGLPPYWGGSGLWGHGMTPAMLLAAPPVSPASGAAALGTAALGTAAGAAVSPEAAFVDLEARVRRARGDDPHLRSARALVRYHIQATDGEVGHVDGMLVDDATWTIRHLIVNTSDWWLGHQVLIAPQSISDVSWLEATVSVELSRDAVKHAPVYDADAPPMVNLEPS
jgi:hypothetical protein